MGQICLKSAICEKSLFSKLRVFVPISNDWVASEASNSIMSACYPFGSYRQLLMDFLMKSAICEKSLFSKLRVIVPKSNDWVASEASNSILSLFYPVLEHWVTFDRLFAEKCHLWKKWFFFINYTRICPEFEWLSWEWSGQLNCECVLSCLGAFGEFW